MVHILIQWPRALIWVIFIFSTSAHMSAEDSGLRLLLLLIRCLSAKAKSIFQTWSTRSSQKTCQERAQQPLPAEYLKPFRERPRDRKMGPGSPPGGDFMEPPFLKVTLAGGGVGEGGSVSVS